MELKTQISPIVPCSPSPQTFGYNPPSSPITNLSSLNFSLTRSIPFHPFPSFHHSCELVKGKRAGGGGEVGALTSRPHGLNSEVKCELQSYGALAGRDEPNRTEPGMCGIGVGEVSEG